MPNPRATWALPQVELPPRCAPGRSQFCTLTSGELLSSSSHWPLLVPSFSTGLSLRRSPSGEALRSKARGTQVREVASGQAKKEGLALQNIVPKGKGAVKRHVSECPSCSPKPAKLRDNESKPGLKRPDTRHLGRPLAYS